MNHFTLITNTITVKGREVLSKPTTCTKADLEVDRPVSSEQQPPPTRLEVIFITQHLPQCVLMGKQQVRTPVESLRQAQARFDAPARALQRMKILKFTPASFDFQTNHRRLRQHLRLPDNKGTRPVAQHICAKAAELPQVFPRQHVPNFDRPTAHAFKQQVNRHRDVRCGSVHRVVQSNCHAAVRQRLAPPLACVRLSRTTAR